MRSFDRASAYGSVGSIVNRQSRSPARRSPVATRKAITAFASVSPYVVRIGQTFSREQGASASRDASSIAE
ncbi:hypothetical protein Psuf_091430 [Phytohabitans suffuscus]|uniref:Uncharacterized protein n=1 Tax=Phytohabitans suffuscus TaxID=624315 RepID=A0A6F8Z074_9ACTN|nr:hypothetical protein Psuf_091430 [Phytohabitans suffuscus]